MCDHQTIRYDIFMAGDIGQAKQVLRGYCFRTGFCVHVHPVDYIYTGGEEAGFKVGIINYPRFPANEATLRKHADDIAQELMHALHQHSYTIVGPTTEWFSRREGA